MFHAIQTRQELYWDYLDSFAQDSGISSALALEIPQSYAKPLVSGLILVYQALPKEMTK